MTKHPRAEAGGAKLSLRLIGRFASYTVSQTDNSQVLLQPLTEQLAEECRSSRPDSRHSTHLRFLDTPPSRVSYIPGSHSGYRRRKRRLNANR